jgi:UDP-N-acetylmuramyl pentapeptide synthase
VKYNIADIASIVQGEWLAKGEAFPVEYLLTDSRKVLFPSDCIFFALPGPRRTGISFIPELYQKGVRSFIVSDRIDTNSFPSANIIIVPDCLEALQLIAAHHRKQFNIPVIGITGSNGKTIVKEWLSHLLEKDLEIVKSPNSYNSQLGVPLSVWQMNANHQLAIFEAGISKKGEMIRLQKIIQPTIGVFTNIGEAHDEGFSNTDEKVT